MQFCRGYSIRKGDVFSVDEINKRKSHICVWVPFKENISLNCRCCGSSIGDDIDQLVWVRFVESAGRSELLRYLNENKKVFQCDCCNDCFYCSTDCKQKHYFVHHNLKSSTSNRALQNISKISRIYQYNSYIFEMVFELILFIIGNSECSNSCTLEDLDNLLFNNITSVIRCFQFSNTPNTDIAIDQNLLMESHVIAMPAICSILAELLPKLSSTDLFFICEHVFSYDIWSELCHIVYFQAICHHKPSPVISFLTRLPNIASTVTRMAFFPLLESWINQILSNCPWKKVLMPSRPYSDWIEDISSTIDRVHCGDLNAFQGIHDIESSFESEMSDNKENPLVDKDFVLKVDHLLSRLAQAVSLTHSPRMHESNGCPLKEISWDEEINGNPLLNHSFSIICLSSDLSLFPRVCNPSCQLEKLNLLPEFRLVEESSETAEKSRSNTVVALRYIESFQALTLSSLDSLIHLPLNISCSRNDHLCLQPDWCDSCSDRLRNQVQSMSSSSWEERILQWKYRKQWIEAILASNPHRIFDFLSWLPQIYHDWKQISDLNTTTNHASLSSADAIKASNLLADMFWEGILSVGVWFWDQPKEWTKGFWLWKCIHSLYCQNDSLFPTLSSDHPLKRQFEKFQSFGSFLIYYTSQDAKEEAIQCSSRSESTSSLVVKDQKMERDVFVIRLKESQSIMYRNMFDSYDEKPNTERNEVKCDPYPCSLWVSKESRITALECELWRNEMETYIKEKGWSTQRHYAVPTTDIPVDWMPNICSWFHEFLKKEMCQVLISLFGDEIYRSISKDSCSSNGKRPIWIALNDAFLVKYQHQETSLEALRCENAAKFKQSWKASKLHPMTLDSMTTTWKEFELASKCCNDQQRYLPLHLDQSTHSFVIALNDYNKDYEGGGTYFSCLGKSVQSSMGNISCFRGDQIHGGNVVLEGCRYIVAVFVMIGVMEDSLLSVGTSLSGYEECDSTHSLPFVSSIDQLWKGLDLLGCVSSSSLAKVNPGNNAALLDSFSIEGKGGNETSNGNVMDSNEFSSDSTSKNGSSVHDSFAFGFFE